jgi:hypothetical protein
MKVSEPKKERYFGDKERKNPPSINEIGKA